MLVGAGEVDAVLLVVAADDGPRAQTVEHLELVDALRLHHGVVALTKVDAVDDRRREAARAEVRKLLAPTGLAAAPIVPVSAISGEEIDHLRAAIRSLAGRPDTAPRLADRAETAPRLAIDRVFTVRGRGAVVTGTLRGGSVATGDVLELVPGDRRIRVREVQVHGRRVDRSDGGRTALNLAGIEASELRRGQVLAAPGRAAAPSPGGAPGRIAAPGPIAAADRLLVALRPPARIRPEHRGLPPDRARLRLHLGTDQVDARVGRSGREGVELPNGAASAILRLDRPIAAAVGDRFVLRHPSPGYGAAGGIVLDVSPPRGASRRRASADRIGRLAQAVDSGNRDAVAAASLDLHGVGVGSIGRAGPELAPDVVATVDAAAVEAVTAHHAHRPDEPGPSLAALRRDLGLRLRRSVSVDPDAAARLVDDRLAALVGDGRLVRQGERVRAPGHEVGDEPSPTQLAAMARLVAALDTPAPPPLAEAARAAGADNAAVRRLERDGRIVRLDDDLAWASTAWSRLVRVALERASVAPLTPAALRDATGTSRKYVMALLEDLGRRGVLARTPAGHVPGPRAGTLEKGTLERGTLQKELA
jgi:selenocysteine-specific elongation factor